MAGCLGLNELGPLLLKPQNGQKPQYNHSDSEMRVAFQPTFREEERGRAPLPKEPFFPKQKSRIISTWFRILLP